MNRIVLAILSLLAPLAAGAQNPDALVRTGRVFLAAQDLASARTQFQSAVTLSPNHHAGNVLLAVTELLQTATDPRAQNFFDRLGLPASGRELYHWSAKAPRDTNGHPVAPAGVNASEFAAFWRTELLPAVVTAGSRLARVTDTTFQLTLNRREAPWATFTLDYGDVLMLRSLLHFFEYAGYTAFSWNSDLPLEALRELANQHALTAERISAEFPLLFTFATTAELPAAQHAIQNAADRYLEASSFIRGRPANLRRLFNLDAGELQDEAEFRQAVADLRASLAGPVILANATNYTVELRNHFTGTTPVRMLFPRFAGNRIVAGSVPDASLGGVVGGLPANLLEYELARHTRLVSELEARRTPETFLFDFGVVTGRVYAVEWSDNLQDWTTLLEFQATNRLHQFSVPLNPAAPPRYYRLSDLSDYVSLSGRVMNRCTGLPVAGAMLEESLTGRQTVTDANGRFVLQTLIPSSPFMEFLLSLSAPGFNQEDLLFVNDDFRGLELSVSPIGAAAPPNDAFAGRTVLSGLPVRASGSLCGATGEGGDLFPSVWWTWTAPVNSRVCLGTDQFLSIKVHTGNSLGNLMLVAIDHGVVCFDAEAGTAYSIEITIVAGLESAFTLELYAPSAVILTQPIEGAEFVSTDDIELSTFVVPGPGTTIQRVRFRANGREIQSMTTPPFNYLWVNVPPGEYELQVEALDSDGRTATDVRHITVRLANDHFADRQSILGDVALVLGSNEGGTVEPDEPDHGGLGWGPLNSAWWTWTPATSGFVTIVAQGTSLHSVNAAFLGVYTGNALPELAPVAKDAFGASFDDTAGSQVSFFATAGTPYQIAVDGAFSVGDLLLQIVRSWPPQVQVLSPADGSRVSLPLTMLISATDPDGSIIGVDVNQRSRWLVSLRQAPYQVVLTNLDAGRHSVHATAVDNTGLVGVSDRIEFTVIPGNDLFANRTLLSGDFFSWEGTTEGASSEPGEPDNLGGPAFSTWWQWTAPFSGLVRVVGVSDGFQLLSVYTGASLPELMAQPTIDRSDFAALDVAFVASAGETYMFAVDGEEGSFSWIFNLALAPPLIFSHPDSQVVEEGSSVTFSVMAFGAGPIGFQWQFFGTNLPGATSSNLVLANVTAEQSGEYRVIVSNAHGAVTSEPAFLTVLNLAIALDAPGLTWTSGGTTPWSAQVFTTHDFVDAARSGTIGNGQESFVQTTVNGPGTLTFWWRVSSQSGGDFLSFLRNGTVQATITGESGWSFRTFSIPAGSHTLRWRYAKDASLAGGQDRGWLDQVTFGP